ncbi:MAG: hypothetical protein JXR46_12250 [Calditrichaceae bacterium]|nr:hypothetical protein [Calditrichaceae bacterium]MBN2709808.1 hypothetical protein [Calditrichaceae bacterium]
MENNEHGLLDNWLKNIKDIYRKNRYAVDSKTSSKEKLDLMCELSVIEQVKNICHTTMVQKAWKNGRELAVHGWIYNIEDGILKDLNICVTILDEVSDTHRLRWIGFLLSYQCMILQNRPEPVRLIVHFRSACFPAPPFPISPNYRW